jgi:hypothetical protein
LLLSRVSFKPGMAPNRPTVTGRRAAIGNATARFQLKLERIPIGWNHPIDKNTLKINLLEHVLIGKVSQLFRNML